MKTCAILALGFTLAGPLLQAEVKDPVGLAIQRELAEPFCYFLAPTDQIGFRNCPKATIITYDGAFVSPFGQLSFYAGAPGALAPVNKRVKTFLEDYLPVIQFAFDRDGLHYAFEAFATPLDLDPRKNLVTFIQCTVTNPGAKPVRGVLGANFGAIDSAVNQDPAFAGFKAQRDALKAALRAQRSTAWHSAPYWEEAAYQAGLKEHAFRNGQMVQGGHLVFAGPAEGATEGMPSYASPLKEAAVEYAFTLKPGEKKVLRFKLPAVPTAASRQPLIAELLGADPDVYRNRTLAFWKAEVAKGERFSVQDPKVMATFRTSLVNDLIASEVAEDGTLYQRVNKLHYNAMWIRDTAFFVRTYDMLGLHDQARSALTGFFTWKDGQVTGFFKPGAPVPPGSRLSVQDDYWGQVLWAVGAHCRTCGDPALLAQVYPLLQPHIDEFLAKCAKDPRGLWPVAGPYDNEAINGHYTGHSLWALLGLKYAVRMALDARHPEDAARWQKVHDDYAANFLKQLRELAARSEGYIPPGMDNVEDGNDWDNASGGLYPFEVLAKDDPLARATLRMVRDFNYQEGVVTYGGNAWKAKALKREGKTAPDITLHHYETFYLTESNTILGEQRKVVEDLYAILAHTGSTNSGFEFCIPAWSTRDPGDNFTPHGWFAARYMSQVRDALVREEGATVHLASVLAPEWVKPGRTVTVTDAPTFFGTVSYRLNAKKDGATLTLDNHWKQPGTVQDLVFHAPWFVKVLSAQADGKPATLAGNTLTLAPGTKRVEFKWKWVEQPDLSYKTAVRLFLEKYHRKPAGANYEFLFPVKNSLQ
jgi:hypothetical protein